MTALPKILLIEDDKLICGSLTLALTEYELDSVSSGKLALIRLGRQKYNQIILDLNLPDMAGAEVCAAIRSRGLRTPILILSGNGNVLTKIKLLDLGANDYLTKPFALGELKARLRVLARSLHFSGSASILRACGLTLNRQTYSVKRNDKVINLRRKEFELLTCLMEHAGQTVSRRELTDRVWSDQEQLWTNTVDVHINHLRNKLDRPFREPLIHTLHGIGYKLARENQL